MNNTIAIVGHLHKILPEGIRFARRISPDVDKSRQNALMTTAPNHTGLFAPEIKKKIAILLVLVII